MGKIQENMLKEDLHQIATNGDTFFSTTDTAYLIFMIIGIIGYFTVPSVANYIVHAGGGNTLLYKVTNMMNSSSRTIIGGSTSMIKDSISDGYNKVSSSMTSYGGTGGYFNNGGKGSGEGYMKDKLSG